MKSFLPFVLTSFASAHTIGITQEAGDACAIPAKDSTRVGEIAILSYHVHVLFKPDQQVQQRELYDDVIKHFNLKMCSAPAGRFDHFDHMCAFNIDEKPTGPWPVPQWAIFALPDEFEDLYSYVMQRRGELTVMTHPNSGCTILDHFQWASWAGDMWPLNRVFKLEDQSPDPWRPNPNRPMHPQKYFDKHGIEVNTAHDASSEDDDDVEDLIRANIRI